MRIVIELGALALLALVGIAVYKGNLGTALAALSGEGDTANTGKGTRDSAGTLLTGGVTQAPGGEQSYTPSKVSGGTEGGGFVQVPPGPNPPKIA